MSKLGNKLNRSLAGLILHPGLLGVTAQLAIHVVAFGTGRERGHRAWAGIRRAVCHG